MPGAFPLGDSPHSTSSTTVSQISSIYGSLAHLTCLRQSSAPHTGAQPQEPTVWTATPSRTSVQSKEPRSLSPFSSVMAGMASLHLEDVKTTLTRSESRSTYHVSLEDKEVRDLIFPNPTSFLN